MKRNIKETNEKNDLILLWAILIFILVLFLYFAGMYYVNTHFEKPSDIGNSSGSINALFSALAFAGIFITILLQRKQLKFQKEELKLTRNELNAQKEEFHIQNETLKIQRFENTFFQMVSLHHDIVNSINLIQKFTKSIKNDTSPFKWKEPSSSSEDAERIINGRAVFECSYKEMLFYLKKVNEISEVNKVYLKNYSVYQNSFGHYFRNLYRIIKLVDQCNFTDAEKYSYTSIIRAQLSDYELLWLYFNCLCENGYEKFKPLIEKYTILKNMPTDKLPTLEHKNLFENSAFERLKE